MTIEGINLGKSFGDIANSVQVAARRCSPLPDRYERTSRIVCVTDSVESLLENQTLSGDISIDVSNQFSAISQTKFSYVDPRITGISPKSGPKSGGTKLSIQGRFLNAGSRVTANIGHMPCDVISRNSTQVTCITSASPNLDKYGVEMMFDRGRRMYDESLYEYLPDPEVVAVTSYGSGQINPGPRGTPAGGSYVFVEGSNLEEVSRPQIVVSYNGQDYFGECQALPANKMICRSPVAKELAGIFRASRSVDRPVELDYGFIFDGVQAVRNISRLGQLVPYSKFQLYPDPSIANFTDANGVKYHKSEYLFIEGENLNQAYRMEDYSVEIGEYVNDCADSFGL